MRSLLLLAVVAVLSLEVLATRATAGKRHQHRHKHHHSHVHHQHHHRHGERHHAGRRVGVGENSTELRANATVAASGTDSMHVALTNASEAKSTVGAPSAAPPNPVATDAAQATQTEKKILGKMKALEDQLDLKEAAITGNKGGKKVSVITQKGLEVNGPLPPDFADLFSTAVAEATNSDASEVKVLKAKRRQGGTFHLTFKAPLWVAAAVQEQAADPDSRLASGQLHDFLVAKEAPHTAPPGADDTEDTEPPPAQALSEEPQEALAAEDAAEDAGAQDASAHGPVPVSKADLPMQRGIDVDSQMPYGELEPFGREDTAQELTERSISESNQMVDQLEKAEVAEEKRAVFRALTRLRGAALTAFDGIARTQTGTIDEYNKLHKWRAMHPLRHLADEESDVSKWAFPDF
mmetsp:Transcript_113230/g.300826  ORF Transcript_113230/g.300826 Transcript_113230/m.300826 type:complete len:408 (-) Transcript_113230:94-1317(-)